MLWLLLFLGCLCAMSFATSDLLQRRFEQTVGGVLLAVGFAAYVLALADLLPVAVWIVPAAGVVSAVYLLYHFFVTKRFTLSHLTPAFWFFVAGCAVCWWTVRGRQFIKWDEFSHWGLSVKNMFYTGRLYTYEGSIGFPDYPPILPLLEYLLVGLAPVFREDFALFMVNIVTLSLVIYPLGAIPQHKPLRSWGYTMLGGVLLAVVPVTYFWRHYIQVTIDGPMGVFMAYACLTALLEQNRRLAPWLTGMGLAALALSKGSGFPLALLCAIVLLVAFWRKPTANAGRWALISRFIPLGTMLAVWGVWKLHLTVLQVALKWSQSDFSVQNLLRLICDGEPAYRVEVWNNFIYELLLNPIYGVIPVSGGTALLLTGLAGLAAVLFCNKERRRAVAGVVIGCIVINLVFAISLLYSYLFVFDPVEAVIVTSLPRYMGTPLCAALMVVTALLIVECRPQVRGWAAAVAVLLVVELAQPYAAKLMAVVLDAPNSAAQTQHERYLYQKAAETIRMVSDGSDVYVIAPQDNGNAINYITYEMAPVDLPDQNNGIGCTYPQDWYNEYTIYCSPEEWSRILYNGPFRYVYLFQVDAYFAVGYKDLFEDEAYLVNGSLLEVVRHEDGVVTLRGLILGENQ